MSEKNYDPEMHSAEHILNGTMDKIYKNGRAFSAQIEKKKKKWYYKRIEQNLSDEEIRTVENKVNEVISSNLDIKEEFMKRENAIKFFNLERLPDDAGDEIRIIKVGDYDACPCIGPHVSNTSQIRNVKIISTSFESDILRLRFKLV